MGSPTREFGQQQQFMLEDMKLDRGFGKIIVVVPPGFQCLLYKKGVLFQTLEEGRYTFNDFNPFETVYTAKMVDARERAIKGIRVTAELRDADGLVVPVELILTINVRLRDMKTFREAEDPFSKLLAMIPNQVATIMAHLQYQDGVPWYLKVREELERYLMVYAVQQTGLQVTSVLIENKPKEDAASRRFNMEDKLAARRRDSRIAEVDVDAEVMKRQAAATAAAAATTGASSADLWTVQAQGGETLIQSYTENRRTDAAAGLLPGTVGITPMAPQQPQLPAGYAGPSSAPALPPGYAGPGMQSPNTYTPMPTAGAPGASGQYGAPSQSGGSMTAPFPGQPAGYGDPAPITGQYRTDMGPIGSTPAAPTPVGMPMSAPGADGQIDPQRLDQEQQRLIAAGFTASADPQRKQVKADMPNGSLSIIFYLDADYPITAPTQIMVNRARNGWQNYQSAVAAHWTPASWLSQIANEIASAGA